MVPDERYHHGDLRHALVRAGLDLLEEVGTTEGISLRRVARRVGVSHAAPYHHFPDKAHLIEALAVAGFDTFTEVLRRARDGKPGDPLERLRATGLAYVRFAIERPALFRLMNRPELRSRGTSGADAGPVERAAHASYQVLESGIRAAQEAGLTDGGEIRSRALAAWSLVHGLAVLAMDGLIDGGVTGADDAERLATAVTGVLGAGLLRR